jgi:hypothetical protein
VALCAEQKKPQNWAVSGQAGNAAHSNRFCCLIVSQFEQKRSNNLKQSLSDLQKRGDHRR